MMSILYYHCQYLTVDVVNLALGSRLHYIYCPMPIHLSVHV